MTYSSSLAMNRQRLATRNQNVVALHAIRPKLGPISNTVILVVLACLLGLLYLTQVTKTNTFVGQVYGLQQQQTQLKSQNDDLQVSSAQLQSLDRAQNSSVAKSMVAVAPSATLTN